MIRRAANDAASLTRIASARNEPTIPKEGAGVLERRAEPRLLLGRERLAPWAGDWYLRRGGFGGGVLGTRQKVPDSGRIWPVPGDRGTSPDMGRDLGCEVAIKTPVGLRRLGGGRLVSGDHNSPSSRLGLAQATLLQNRPPPRR